jgi:hypothetical protein
MKISTIFLITYRLFLLRTRNVSHQSFRGNQNTHFVFSNFSFENDGVCEIMWKSMVEPEKPKMTKRRMHISRLVPKATNTHSGYVILIACLLQQWLHERALLLRYTYIACLVANIVGSKLLHSLKTLRIQM